MTSDSHLVTIQGQVKGRLELGDPPVDKNRLEKMGALLKPRGSQEFFHLKVAEEANSLFHILVILGNLFGAAAEQRDGLEPELPDLFVVFDLFREEGVERWPERRLFGPLFSSRIERPVGWWHHGRAYRRGVRQRIPDEVDSDLTALRTRPSLDRPPAYLRTAPPR